MSPSRTVYEALCKLLAFQHPHSADNHYVSPPRAIRYTLERWSHEDERDNQPHNETWAPTYCVACVSVLFDMYCVGEWYIDDTLSCDTYHIACAPRGVRARAFIGLVLCAFRAVMGIDNPHTHTPY